MVFFAFNRRSVVASALLCALLGLGLVAASDESVESAVDKAISGHKVTVFSKSYCGFSMRAKGLLGKLLVSKSHMHVVELDQREDGPAIQDYLLKLTGARTVPRVFIGGEFVGGSSEVADLHSNGKLVAKLKAAGVDVNSSADEL